MRFGGRYVLGIDALPRGNYAAIVVGRTITHTFAIGREGRLVLPLEERVRLAVEMARRQRGVLPSEIRLVCIDDGIDGEDLGRLHAWLADQEGINLQILEPDLPDLAAAASVSVAASVSAAASASISAGRTPAVSTAGGAASALNGSASAASDDDARSVSRACEAALW